MRELTSTDLNRATGGFGFRRQARPAPAQQQQRTLTPEETMAQLDSKAEKAFGSMG